MRQELHFFARFFIGKIMYHNVIIDGFHYLCLVCKEEPKSLIYLEKMKTFDSSPLALNKKILSPEKFVAGVQSAMRRAISKFG